MSAFARIGHPLELRLGSRTIACAIAVALLVAPELAAQEHPPNEAACDDAEHRQFDFWIGEWRVTNPAGDEVGTNAITSIAGGCGLHERWRGAGGGVGESLNAYDARTGRWHQTWVGGRGLVLRLEGGLRDGSMVMEGDLESPDGVVRQRITWTPAPDGTVRQHWETSDDDGGSWATVFDGTYHQIESD